MNDRMRLFASWEGDILTLAEVSQSLHQGREGVARAAGDPTLAKGNPNTTAGSQEQPDI